MAVSKEDFLKVWKDSSREDILNQYYYDYKFTRELCDKVNKAIEYINNHKEPLHHWFDEPDCDYWLATNPDDLLDILKDSDDE